MAGQLWALLSYTRVLRGALLGLCGSRQHGPAALVTGRQAVPGLGHNEKSHPQAHPESRGCVACREIVSHVEPSGTCSSQDGACRTARGASGSGESSVRTVPSGVCSLALTSDPRVFQDTQCS